MQWAIIKQKEVIVKKYILALLIPLSASCFAAFDTDIETRQNAFSDIKDNVEMAGDMLDSGKLDWQKLQQYGQALTSNASILKNHFPEGSREGSNAKAAVWKNPDKFSEGLQMLNSGFDSFYSAAKANDKSALVAGFKQATKTCKACHRKFRVKK